MRKNKNIQQFFHSLLEEYLLETKKIENNAAKEAADINQDNGINSADLLFLKKHLLGKQIISQNKY